MTDVTVSYRQGDTIARVTPNTQTAKDWIGENVQAEGYQWLGKSLCVEHRYVDPLVDGMLSAGLDVETE